MTRPRDRQRISHFVVGLISIIVVTSVFALAWSRWNPLADPFTVRVVFSDASSLRTNSPVRLAGVNAGRVASIEPLPGGAGARVVLELHEDALPIHRDAELRIRPRLFFGGNYFVDLEPGSPAAPILGDGEEIGASRTSANVQLTDVLSALDSDTRTGLQTLVREYADALDKGGAEGLRAALPEMRPAYRDGAITADALLGEDPEHDTRNGLRGTARTVAALAEDRAALQGLVTDFAVTAGALARENAALEASVPELRDLLRTAYPALGVVNDALPALRSLARDALPGVRRLGPAITASLPAVREARALMGRTELRATASALERRVGDLNGLVNVSVGLFEQGRAASSCTSEVLVPLITKDFPDPDFPANKGNVNQKLQRSIVGLAGESRGFDSNQSFFHASFVPPSPTYRPAPPTAGIDKLPQRRPDIPCETQQAPNLDAPAISVLPNGTIVPLSATPPPRRPSLAVRRAALLEAKELITAHHKRLDIQRERRERKRRTAR